MDWGALAEHMKSSWRDINLVMRKELWHYSQPPITATDVETKELFSS